MGPYGRQYLEIAADRIFLSACGNHCRIFHFQKAGEWKICGKFPGLLVGVYTGGTPNLASLKMMLDVDANTYILTHTYDLMIGVFYLAFLMTIGQKMFHRFLPKFPIPSR
jgi:uncharacterized membrane protein